VLYPTTVRGEGRPGFSLVVQQDMFGGDAMGGSPQDGSYPATRAWT
jgi:hypothetical protein